MIFCLDKNQTPPCESFLKLKKIFQCVAVFVAVVAAAHASIVGLGAVGGVDSAAVIAGPSGTVARTGVLGLNAGIIGAPLGLGLGGVGLGGLGLGGLGLRSGLGLGGLIVPAGSGLEGQYIPDINEKLYDDGSYKPQIYGL